MRWRVPELALLLGDRAAAQARRAGDTELWFRAEAVALFASNRLGRGVATTERAIAAVRNAEVGGEVGSAAELRVELACCARSAGSREVALRVLQPVLEQERNEPELRAHALLELAASLPAHHMSVDRVHTLDEAERLYTEEAGLGRDTTRLLRARVSMARAEHHRRNAEFTAAAESARAGLEMLERLGDPTADSGEVHARLALERAQALLDLGERSAAVRVAEPVLDQPLRAAAAASTGWLRFALATRLYLPEGEHSAAMRLLTEALAGAERHELGDLQAEVLGALSHVHESSADFAEALRCVRGAYAADRSWRAAVHAARIRLLEEFPAQQAAQHPAAGVSVPRQQSAPDTRAAVRGPQDTAESQDVGKPQDTGKPWHPADGADIRESVRRLMDTLTGGGEAAPAEAAPRAPQSSPLRPRSTLEEYRVAAPPPEQRASAAETGSHHAGRPEQTDPSPDEVGSGDISAPMVEAEVPDGAERLPGLAQEIRKAAQREQGDDEGAVAENGTAWDSEGAYSSAGPPENVVPLPDALFAGPTARDGHPRQQRDALPGGFGDLPDLTTLTDTGSTGATPSDTTPSDTTPSDTTPADTGSTDTGPWNTPAIAEWTGAAAGEGFAEAPSPARDSRGSHAADPETSPPETSGPELPAPDVTTIMPVIPGPLESEPDPPGAIEAPIGRAGRRRQSEPTEAESEEVGIPEASEEHSVDDFLAKHRELLEGISPPRGARQETEAAGAAGSGGDAGLADLLAEALVAYENGKRNQPETAGDATQIATSYHTDRGGSDSTERADTDPRSTHHSEAANGSSGARARHRHAAADNPYGWTPPAG